MNAKLTRFEAEAQISAILDRVAQNHKAPDNGDLAERLDKRDDALSLKDNLGVNYPEIVNRAGDAALKIVQLTGAGSEIADVINAIALGLTLLLAVAKLEGKCDWATTEGYVAFAGGIPDGFKSISQTLSDAVRALTGGKRSTDASDAGGDVPRHASKKVATPDQIDPIRIRRPSVNPAVSPDTGITDRKRTHSKTDIQPECISCRRVLAHFW